MTVSGGSGEYDIVGPAETGLTAADVRRLFQVSHDKWVLGEKNSTEPDIAWPSQRNRGEIAFHVPV